MSNSSESLYQTIYDLVRQIPSGKVATYGQIAALLGKPRHARQVGYALFRVAPDRDIPWQRVVNAKGTISLSPMRLGNDLLQRILLEREGIEFDDRGYLNLKRYQWQAPDMVKMFAEASISSTNARSKACNSSFL